MATNSSYPKNIVLKVKSARISVYVQFQTYLRSIKTVLPQASTLVQCTGNFVRSALGSISIHGPTGNEIVKDIDLTGKTCLITGANSGLGLEMTRCLSARNCTVLMGCRNTYTAKTVIRDCENHDRLKLGEVNLGSLKSVKNYTDRVLKEEEKIDILILNAGVFGIPWTLTEDGLETTFQVNFLSQWYLLQNLEEILAPDARVVFLSSESHRYVNWPIEKRIMPTEELLSLPQSDYTSIRAFNISKLCGLLCMHHLRRRGAGAGVFAAHPGAFVRTQLCRNWWPYELLYAAMLPFAKSISQAAATPLYCAVSPDLDGMTALYVSDCRRCAESDLALDSTLSCRVMELAQHMLDRRARGAYPQTLQHKSDNVKDIDEEPKLMSNYFR